MVAISYPSGSKLYFENIAVQGVKVESVAQTSLGHVHISLVADKGITTPLDVLRKRYIDAYTPDLPVGMDVTVSITKRPAFPP